MSLYDDLGLGPDATEAEIKAAHRRAAKRHHPDAGGDRDEFERVQRAALILRDPAKRERYDRDGTIEDGPSPLDFELQGAVSLINDAFSAALASASNLATVNIIANAKTVLQHSITNIEQEQAAARGELGKFRKARKRVKHKGNGPNILGDIIDDRIRNCEARIKATDINLGAHKRALKMLADYDWEVDAAPDWAFFTEALPRGLSGSTTP